MKGAIFSLVVLFSVLSSSTFALAQRRMSDQEGAAACAACGGGFIFFFIAVIVVDILILAWVAKDAKNRGMGSPLAWMVLVFFTSIIGLIIYLVARPSGEMETCPNCGNKRLKAMAKCPHCGN